MQQEIVDEHAQSIAARSGSGGDGDADDLVQQLVEAAGFDMETFQSLPETIRNELLEQAGRDHPEIASNAAARSGAAEGNIDNASFLTTLAPELRTEVLITADSDFLQTLPPELVAEAQMLRERAANEWQRAERNGGYLRGADGANQYTGDDDDEYSEETSDSLSEEETRAISSAREAAARELHQLASRGRGGNNGRDGVDEGDVDSRSDGKMWVPTDDLSNQSVPLPLLSTLVHIVTNAEVTMNFSMLRAVLVHVSKHRLQRDLLLRLLGGVLQQDQRWLNSVMGSIVQQVSSEGTLDFKPLVNPLASRNDSRQEANHLIRKRIVNIISHLVTSNGSVLYDLLYPRDETGIPLENIRGLVDDFDGEELLLEETERKREEFAAKAEAREAQKKLLAGSNEADQVVTKREGRHSGNIAVNVKVMVPVNSLPLPPSIGHTMNESGSHQVISVKLRRKQRVRRVIDLLVSSCDVVSSALHLSITDPACAGDEKEDLKSVCIYDTCRVLGLTDNSILWVDVRLDSEAAMRRDG